MLQKSQSKIGRVGALAFAALALFAANPGNAAIIWSAPVDHSGRDSDVIITGDLIDAVTFGRTTNVNGVVFNHLDLGVPNTSHYGVLENYGVFGPDWDAASRDLVAATSYVRLPSQLEFSFGLLPAGNYLLQLFLPQWDVNWATAFSLNGVMSAPVQAGGGLPGGDGYPARAKPQWITAQFEADGVTEYKMLPEAVTDYQVLAALQLRTIAASVPEPSSWAMFIVGLALVGATMRNRSGPITRAVATA